MLEVVIRVSQNINLLRLEKCYQIINKYYSPFDTSQHVFANDDDDTLMSRLPTIQKFIEYI